MSYNNKKFWKLMGVNIWKKRRSFFLFFVNPFFAVAIIFLLMELRGILQSSESQGLVKNAGIYAILFNGVLIIAGITSLLLILSVRVYALGRLEDYEILRVLGLPPKKRKKLQIVEYIGGMTIALIMGGGVGTAIAFVIRIILKNAGFPTLLNYLQATGICIILFTLAMLINEEVLVEMDLTSTRHMINKKSKLPQKPECLLGVVGIIAAIASAWCYWGERDWGEVNLFFTLFLFGSFLVWRYGWTIFLRIKKHKISNVLHTVKWNPFYCGFHAKNLKMFLVFLLQFYLLFYCSTQLAGNFPFQISEKEYPYKFVWKIRGDDSRAEKLLNEFENKYQAEIKKIPAVNVVTMRGKAAVQNMYGDGVSGQNIGIPENTYFQLTGKKLNLEGQSIYIVYHQMPGDKAHPIDYTTLGNQKLHFGSAYLNGGFKQNELTHFFREYKVSGYERKNLIGYWGKGDNENIVVFSDEYFNKIKKEEIQKDLEAKAREEILGNYYDLSEGELKGAGIERAEDYPDSLALIKVENEFVDDIHSKLDIYEKDSKEAQKSQYIYDSTVKMFYDSREAISENTTERTMTFAAYSFQAFLIMFAVLYIVYMNIMDAADEKKKTYEFLKHMGIRKREILKILLAEFDIFTYVPCVVSVVFGSSAVAALANLRLLDITDRQNYFLIILILWIGVLLNYILFYGIFRHSIKNKLQQ